MIVFSAYSQPFLIGMAAWSIQFSSSALASRFSALPLVPFSVFRVVFVFLLVVCVFLLVFPSSILGIIMPAPSRSAIDPTVDVFFILQVILAAVFASILLMFFHPFFLVLAMARLTPAKTAQRIPLVLIEHREGKGLVTFTTGLGRFFHHGTTRRKSLLGKLVRCLGERPQKGFDDNYRTDFSFA